MAEPRAVARLEPLAIDAERELADLVAASSGDGAMVCFVGLTRPGPDADPPIERLFLEHHPRLTQRSLDTIAADALERFDVTGTHVVHRCGAVEVGQPIVFVAATSRHRRSAFEAVDYLMDRLKTDAMFWKREEGPRGSRWIEPGKRDLADRDRWTA